MHFSFSLYSIKKHNMYFQPLAEGFLFFPFEDTASMPPAISIFVGSFLEGFSQFLETFLASLLISP